MGVVRAQPSSLPHGPGWAAMSRRQAKQRSSDENERNQGGFMEKGAFQMSLEGRLKPHWLKLDGKGIVGRGKSKHEARRHGPRAAAGDRGMQHSGHTGNPSKVE